MKLFRVLPFLVLPLACSEPGFQPSPGTKLVRASSPIQGGTTDSTSKNVVGILLNTSQGAGVCTGSLIAPNLVLTARHCVGDIASNLSSCSAQPFSSPAAASSFRITTSYNAIDPIFNGSGGWPAVDNSTWFGAAEVILDPTTNSICGGDVALIRLSTSIPSVCPLVPRVDSILTVGETYTAKGFGITGPAYDSQGNPISTYQSTAGTRRTVSGMTVACLNQSGCQTADGISGTLEWVGAASTAKGTCEGDSGGPSLDSIGRVTGAVSRGPGDACNQTVYGSVYGHAAWIKAKAAYAAAMGGYNAADWVDGGSTTVNPCGSSSDGGTTGGCPSGQTCQDATGAGDFLCLLPTGDAPSGLVDCLSSGTCTAGFSCFYDDSTQATAHCYQDCSGTTGGGTGTTGGGTGTTGGGTGTTGGGTGTSGGGTGTTGGGTGTTGGGTGTGGCQSGEFCPAGYGICLTNAGDLPADATVCSQSMTCTTAGASCYADSSGSSTGHCYRACTAPTYNCVGSGTTCFGVDSTTAFCLDSSTGGIPTSAGDCLSAPNSCPSSQTCVCTAGTTSCTAARCIEECGPGATGGGTGSTGGGTGTSGGGTGTSGGGTGTSGGGTGTTGGSGGTTGGGTGTTGGSGGTTGGGTATTGGSGGTTGGGTATTGGSGGTTGGGTATTGGSGGTTGGGTATTGGSGGFTGGGTGLIWPTGGGNGGGGGKSDSGCSCTEAPMGSLMWLALSGLGFLRRRRR